MIPLYGADGKTRNPVDLGSLTLNDPTDSKTSTYELNAVVTTVAIDGAIDSGNERGAILAPAKRIYYVLKIDGVIRATDPADLYDKQAALIAAADPDLLTRANSSTVGVIALDFDVPTADTSNFASGVIASRYMVRPRTTPIPVDSIFQGLGRYFSLDLLVPDPRRIYQTESTLSGAGTASNLGNDSADVTLSIAMAGAGSALFSIQRVGSVTGTKSLHIDLSGRSNGQTVTVTMKDGQILVATTAHDEMYVSGDFWDLDPGDNTISISNGTNATVTTKWRHSWVA